MKLNTILTAIAALTMTVLVWYESGVYTSMAVFLGFGYAINSNRVLKGFVEKNNVSLTMKELDAIRDQLKQNDDLMLFNNNQKDTEEDQDKPHRARDCGNCSDCLDSIVNNQK